MKRIIIVALLLLIIVVGCSNRDTTVMQKEYEMNTRQIEKFQETQPIPKIEFSNTRDAVIKRIERWSDPNKISYIYLVSFGRVMAFYPVKGSVESKRSYLSSVWKVYSAHSVPIAIDAPDIDGTYGDNADSIFFFTIDGVYVEWHGDYMWVDQPLKLTTQPELVYTVPLDQKP